ncbi:MAG: hypothetical protein LBT34_03140 [Clostridiales Family XIII bacterium]|jgi:hypothetical protein|nr:hypothetical protein [Clostridiales Family XIII bacterium]
MKQFLVLCSMILLGVFIYSLIAGPGDSILSLAKGVWASEVEMRTNTL